MSASSARRTAPTPKRCCANGQALTLPCIGWAGSTLLGRREVHAVDGLGFTLRAGETLSLVGDSGSGKTTSANMVLGLARPSAGRILWQGTDLATMDTTQRAAWRVQTNAVFQDPMGLLDPRMRVGALIAEPLRQLPALTAQQRSERVDAALRAVQLLPARVEDVPLAIARA